jgi:isoamylase
VVLDPPSTGATTATRHRRWKDSVFYEVHVRGFTKQMDAVPEHLRGTFAGLASEAAIAHLKNLGVTAVELLPVHAFNDERRLIDLGLANYWGYNTIGFFAPEPRYCAAATRRVQAHGEGAARGRARGDPGRGLQPQLRRQPPGPHAVLQGHRQPQLLPPRDRGPSPHYLDFTGTGNTLNASHPAMLRLVMDSLRYWVEEMHVDGFRFDLAPPIARNGSTAASTTAALPVGRGAGPGAQAA